MNQKMHRIFEATTRRAECPPEACAEWGPVVGRCGGKGQVAVLIAVFMGALQNHSASFLGTGLGATYELGVRVNKWGASFGFGKEFG